MRWAELYEGKRYPLGNTKVWIDPSHQQLVNLLKTVSLRGLVTPNHLVVWSAHDDVHENIRTDLVQYGFMTQKEASWGVKICLDQEGSDFSDFDYWSGNPTIVNGIAILSDGDLPRTPSLQRALGAPRPATNTHVGFGAHEKAMSEGSTGVEAPVDESFIDKVTKNIKAQIKPDKVTPQRGRSMPGSNPEKRLVRRKRFM